MRSVSRDLPDVSVVMPVRNEKQFIRTCIESLIKQDYAGRLEILVIDGMSEDGTREEISQLQSIYPNRISLIDNPGRVVTDALNLGISAAHGEYIARADAHAFYAEDYISMCVAVARRTAAADVGGIARIAHDGSSRSRLIAMIHESPFGIGVAKFRQATFAGGWVDTVWPGFYVRSVLLHAGPYRSELVRSEDIEMNARLRQAGERIYLSPDIHLHYLPRQTFQKLLLQNYGNGMGVIQCLLVRPRAISLRHLVPLAFVLGIIGGLLGGLLWPDFWVVTGMVLGVYGLLALWFGFKAAGSSPLLGLALPVLFLSLHLSYGFGSLRALFSLGLARIKHGEVRT